MNQDLETKGGNLSHFRVFSIYFVVFSPEVGNNFSVSPFFFFRRSPFSWGKKWEKVQVSTPTSARKPEVIHLLLHSWHIFFKFFVSLFLLIFVFFLHMDKIVRFSLCGLY